MTDPTESTGVKPVSDFVVNDDDVRYDIRNNVENLKGSAIKLINGQLIINLPTSKEFLEVGSLWMNEGVLDIVTE